MNGIETKVGSKLYAYMDGTDQVENDADIRELYKVASKDKASKLMVFGGLHGYEDTGEPTGQDEAEKSICSFSFDDQLNKAPGTGINFTYENIAKYTTKGSDVTPERQRDIAEHIKRALDGGYYVLLCWCFSLNWARSMGL